MITKAEEKLYRSLHQKKFRDEHGLFIVEGRKAVQELIDSDYKVTAVLSTEGYDGVNDTIVCDKKQLSKLSGFKTPSDIIAVAELPKEPVTLELTSYSIFVLEAIRDPGNLGSILRTIRWFGGSEIILSNDCADHYNSKTIQASMGAAFHLRVQVSPIEKAISDLRKNDFEIWGTDMNGESVSTNLPESKTAIIIGNEGHGISTSTKSLCDGMLAIEGGGFSGVESLNAAMSVGIIAHLIHTKNGN